MVGPIGRLVKLAGSGIGLAAEAVEAHKQRSRSAPNVQTGDPGSARDDQVPQLIAPGQAVPKDESNSRPPSYHKYEGEESDDDSDSTIDEDEKAWELDEAAERLDPHSYQENEEKSEKDLVQEIIRMAGPPPPIRPHLPLPYPVIIPQRRPQDKSRGFVRAYAPVLYECGIEQDTFLRFLKSFHQASKSSPILDVIFLSAAIAGFAPSIYATITATIVQVIVGTAKELQSRKRTNNFLDEMNEKLFAPRGLYAFIMTFKPDDERPIGAQQMSLADQYIRYQGGPGPSKVKETLKDIRLGDGRTYGEIELPEAAPLIYPSLEEATVSPGTKEQLKSSQKFVADYFDRRAQAKYAAEHPNSNLAVPADKPKFASRYSDPNHPANSGSLISLLTGGAVNPAARREQRREAKRTYKDAKRVSRGRKPRGPRQKGGIVKKILHQDLLYLMVVNMPSDEEIAAARQEVARIQAEKEAAKAAKKYAEKHA